jgi:hypothetical protein
MNAPLDQMLCEQQTNFLDKGKLFENRFQAITFLTQKSQEAMLWLDTKETL